MAITEGNIALVSGADASSTTRAIDAVDSTAAGTTGAILFFMVHEGAPTTYTWTDNQSTSSGNFLDLGTVDGSAGAGSGDISMNAGIVWSPNTAVSHTLTCTFGAARTFRYGGAVVLIGNFTSASILAATTQTAEGTTATTVDAGSLVTDAAAYLVQFGGNYNGVAMSAAGTGWTIKSNATGGRHFQARNEASANTFDPSYTLASDGLTWLTIAAAIKEVAVASATPKGPFGLSFHGPFGGPIS